MENIQQQENINMEEPKIDKRKKHLDYASYKEYMSKTKYHTIPRTESPTVGISLLGQALHLPLRCFHLQLGKPCSYLCCECLRYYIDRSLPSRSVPAAYARGLVLCIGVKKTVFRLAAEI